MFVDKIFSACYPVCGVILLQIEVDGLIVEWDDNKAEINKQKHNVHFEDAAQIFLDGNRVTEIDYSHSDEEIRYVTIGRVGKILFVVYTERGEAMRLISARKADKNERRKYFYGQNFYLPRNGLDG